MYSFRCDFFQPVASETVAAVLATSVFQAGAAVTPAHAVNRGGGETNDLIAGLAKGQFAEATLDLLPLDPFGRVELVGVLIE